MRLNSRTTRAVSGSGRGVALVGTYPPRRCGIATFTSDLRSAIVGATGWARCGVVALTGPSDRFDYPSEVEMEIRTDRTSDYEVAADYLNESATDVVCLQHEFGIFGGAAGSNIRFMLDRLRKPVVTTLHTVIRAPEPEYRRALADVIERSDLVVTMSRSGARILRDVYGLRGDKVVVAYHGTPPAALVEPEPFKERLGLKDRFVAITFGLISPGKGIEMVVDALPNVVGRHPEVIYLVVGATHPEVARVHGDAYLSSLRAKVSELDLGRHVRFVDRFVSPRELQTLVAASDVFITPYLSREQVTSGCLAYALSMGKAVVSTPYWHAQELLAQGTGILVGFGAPGEIAHALGRLMEDRDLLRRLRYRAYAAGSRMSWPRVARRYADAFDASVRRRATRAQAQVPAGAEAGARAGTQVPTSAGGGIASLGMGLRHERGHLPGVCLDHLAVLTDGTGLVQFGVPGRADTSSGYTVDDAARALVLAARLAGHRGRPEWRREATRSTHVRSTLASAVREHPAVVEHYLRFIERARTRDGAFLNVMLPGGEFVEGEISQDAQGRVVWGLGEAAASCFSREMRGRAAGLLAEALTGATSLTSPRACAYAICGLAAALRLWGAPASGSGIGEAQRLRAYDVRRALLRLTGHLVGLYRAQSSDGWRWFEDRVTYGNAKLCEALLLSHQVSGDPAVLNVALESLEFLTRIQYDGDYFDLVGNQGWYVKGGAKPSFGQQPVDASYLVQAYDRAYEATGSPRYAALAGRAWDWFTGRNRLGLPLYDERTGVCGDGLDPQGVSSNSGAESTVCCLLALLTVTRLRRLAAGVFEEDARANAQEDAQAVDEAADMQEDAEVAARWCARENLRSRSMIMAGQVVTSVECP